MKALGLTAASTMLPGCQTEVRHLVPYLLPDDEIVPGIADWYASTCGECQAGCGIIVRVMEGRAKKIEGNPDHPLNRGKLCAQGQAALQRLYNPDRLQGPAVRPRDDPKQAWTATSWEDGISRLAGRLRDADGQVIMISRPLSGTLAELVSTFVRSVGGRLFYYEPDSELSLRAATEQTFRVRGLPHYDIAQADYLLSFGAPLLEQWVSPVAYGIAFGHMRQGRPGRRGRFVHIEPRLSLTGANADRWVPVRPGAEGLLALGIGQLLLMKGKANLPRKEQASFERFYGSRRLEEVAARTDVPLDRIKDMAQAFADAERPLAISGGAACAHTNAFATHLAINGLNVMAGSLNREGGLRWYPDAPFRDPTEVEWLSERRIGELAHTVAAGRHRPVLLLYDCNPIFTLPPTIPIRQLFSGATFIASDSSCLDESTAMADVILPDHSRLETWGDHVQDGSAPRRGASLIQPVITPLYDTRALGETVLDLTRQLHPDTDLPRSFAELLRARWDGLEIPHQSPPPASSSRWERHLQRGGWWPSHSTRQQKLTPSFLPSAYEPARFDGEAAEFPLHFYPYPSTTLGRGRGANLPWLQELPDTLTSAVWGSWLEINPATAQSYGIRQGDMVRIHSPRGSIDAPALHYPGIRPDVIAMPIGQGHTDYGRYANARGTNPLSILAPLFDVESGALALGGTRVRLEPLAVPGNLVLLEHPGAKAGTDLLSIERPRPAKG